MPMTTDPDHDPHVGQLVGNYRVGKLIGKGGMGAVYLATHQTIGKQVALKVLLPDLTARADISARFIQEAISAAHVRGPNGRTHRNVVEPVDTGTLPDGQHFIMVEYLDGCDLEQYTEARGGRLAEDEVLAIGFQTCAALHAAHTAKDPHTQQLSPIVHRDLKLANLFITRDDTGRQLVKLLDFGIAKVAGAVRATGIQTGAGTVMGSPAYMAPEQVRAPLSVDARADVYAFGVVLYQLLTGRLPHVADNAMGYVLAKQEQTPPPISALAPGVSRLWDVIVMRCLTWEPAHRYSSIRQIVNDLVEGTQGLPGIPDAATILSAAWPTFWTDAGPGDETTRAAVPSMHTTGNRSHATGGTLAAAAGSRSSTTAPRRRTGLAIAGVGVLVVGAGLVALVATSGDDHRSSPASSSPATNSTTTPGAAAASSATAPTPSPASSSTPAPPPAVTAPSSTATPASSDATAAPTTNAGTPDASSSPATTTASSDATAAPATSETTSTRPTTTRTKPTRPRSSPATSPATTKKKAGDIGRID
jgi:serine/threonine-protein kinase